MITQQNNPPVLNIPPFIQQHVPLKDKNWFKTGGAARYFAQPVTPAEFQGAVQFAQVNNLPVFLLGEGANILISDEGFDGLVICPALKEITVVGDVTTHCLVKAGAGVSMDALINHCLEHQISGLEEFSGIPGSVGGSVYINLHYYEFLLSHFLVSAEVIDKKTGALSMVDASWFEFGYNQSKLIEGGHYLASATFKLKKINELETAYAQGRRKEIIRHRKARYPNALTCGSFFRNFHENEVTLESNGKKMIFVAYYLDKIGVKGQLKVGDAIVSYQHANMIVNQGTATTADIVQLTRTMQQMVKDTFGIVPQPECRLIGFKEYPLLSPSTR